MEKQKGNDWLTTDKRFVGFIDILGFKDLVARKSHDDIYTMLNEISNIRTTIDNYKDQSENGRFVDSEVYTVSFSDSIVFFSKNNSPENFDLFIYSIEWLFRQAIMKQIPLKGAIAYGEISINKSNQIYFGQAIIDAYLLQEEVNYFGVVAHNTIEDYIRHRNGSILIKRILKEFMTPLKCGNISHLNLIWFDDKNIPIGRIIDSVKSFKFTVSGHPRRYIDNTIRVIEDWNKEKKL